VLTALPKSWTVNKIAEEFAVSNYMARKVKKLVKVNGILSTPNPKAGKTLQKKSVNEVKEFYCSDSVSRVMPGRKDCISVLIDGERQHVQKRLVLCNLKEAFQIFKDKNPELKVGLSKFAA